MIERWNIDKCYTIRVLFKISPTDIANRLYLTRQSIYNAENKKIKDDDALKRFEMLYTLALKDIMEERNIQMEDIFKELEKRNKQIKDMNKRMKDMEKKTKNMNEILKKMS